ncbi:helix-turn-helix transcriptional regulator [Polymorphospora sp. NPDC050346]|uniref:helix-turn-helix transcriptional regulator n=1 Tax=Polymorphospora sp. NPDC050346 TaxID=3155780 RepID=UPI0033EDFC26
MAGRRVRFAQRRKAAGFTQEALAERLAVERSTVVRWESAATEPHPWMWPRLAAALNLTADELQFLIDDVAPERPGSSAAPGDRARGATYAARSHMFIPAFVGAQAAAEIAQRNRLKPATEQWFDCYKGPLDLHGGGDLYVWPFGVAMFHVVEDLDLPDLAALAVWRQRTYQDRLRWATGRLRELCCDDVSDALYVFSLYWMAQPIWSGDTLQAALRILSMPKVLLGRDEDADIEQVRAVEQALLANGFDHPEIVQFGVAGISVGCASWSAISYHPLPF